LAVWGHFGEYDNNQGHHAHIHQNGRQTRRAGGALSDDFRTVVLFSGIGLLVLLIAVCTGVQGVWL
jgi:hypothetical protein